MILSALLTSVGINLCLCLLFFALYSVLRKQPLNFSVYAPRFLSNRKKQQQQQQLPDEEGRAHDFILDRLLPSAGWAKRAWQLSEDDLLSINSLDAVVFVRIFVFCVRVFAVGGVIGVCILLPVNYLGNQLSIDFSDLPNKSLDSFSISNVDNGSNRFRRFLHISMIPVVLALINAFLGPALFWLWIHFSAAYVFTGVVCYLLYCEYLYISSKRIACFYSSKRQPRQFSILVSGIPTSSGRSYSEIVESFFTENHPSTYLSNSVVRRTSKIRGLINDTEKLYRRLAHLKSSNYSRQTSRRDGFLGLFGRKVNVLEQYEKKLEDLEDNVRMEQSSLASQEVPAAFVSFNSRLGAAVALHIQQGINPTEWVTEGAPDPQDVHWPFFSASFLKRWIGNLIVGVACIALTILFLIPVVLVQGLANLDQLETWFPFLKSVLSLTVVSQLITGYLPSLILQFFLFLVPPIMITLSSMQGYISFSQIEKSACIKMLVFTIWNIFFANVLSGSALSQVNVLLEPKNIPKVLAEAVPGQASFFISYVVTSGWTSLASELLRLVPLVCSFIKRLFVGKDDDEIKVPSFPYYSEIPMVLFFALLGLTYFFLAPLILPFVLVYFCLGYIIFRNQLVNVYAPKYETDGKFWPVVHNSTIFSLILMHVIAIGIFGLKDLPLASSLTVPLPILTLVFNEYCRKRFLPIFKDYPTECLVKKDREDRNDPSMTEFFGKLVTAYQDPALMPVQQTRSGDTRTSPLLHAEV